MSIRCLWVRGMSHPGGRVGGGGRPGHRCTVAQLGRDVGDGPPKNAAPAPRESHMPNLGSCDAGDLWFLRFYSGLRRPHYDQLMAELETIVGEIAVLDAEAIDRANQRRELIERAKDLRDTVWPIVPHHHGRRPPAPDERPLPPLRREAEHLTGRRLRSVCLALLGR